MNNIIKSNLFLAVLCLCLTLGSCKKLLEVDLPLNTNTSQTVYNDKATATAVISGIYAQLNQNGYMTGDMGLSIRSGLLADELTAVTPAAQREYLYNLDGVNGMDLWSGTYETFIYQLNAAIEGLEKADQLLPSTKSILEGEAHFTRAWLYFILVNYYGDVPIITTTDFNKNGSIARSSVDDVYQLIIEDLLEAEIKLNDNYLDKNLQPTIEQRVRPNKSAAKALLARVYLYTANWSAAESKASEVIGNDQYELVTDLNNVFKKDSRETIWALQPNSLDNSGNNTNDAKWLINPFGFLDPFYYPSDFLLGAFELGDARKNAWITQKTSGMPIPYKYKEGWNTMSDIEYPVVLRLAEQYLIRAEARAHQGKLTGQESAEEDINSIRNRASLVPFAGTTEDELLTGILQERRVELFLEWGQRWLDLKRTQTLDDLMQTLAPAKGVVWQDYKSLLPIPQAEFKYNTALRGHQNPGYQELP